MADGFRGAAQGNRGRSRGRGRFRGRGRDASYGGRGDGVAQGGDGHSRGAGDAGGRDGGVSQGGDGHGRGAGCGGSGDGGVAQGGDGSGRGVSSGGSRDRDVTQGGNAGGRGASLPSYGGSGGGGVAQGGYARGKGASYGGGDGGASHGVIGSGGVGRGAGGSGNQQYNQPRPQYQLHQWPQLQQQQQQVRPQQPQQFRPQQPQQFRPQQPHQFRQQQQQQQPPQRWPQQHYRQPQQQPPQRSPGNRFSGEGSSSNRKLEYSGDDFAAKLRQCAKSVSHDGHGKSVSHDKDGLTSEMQKLKLPNAPKLEPMKRPDKGRPRQNKSDVNLVANHFLVSFDPDGVIRHYDIDPIDDKPEATSSRASSGKRSKANLSKIFEKFCAESESPMDMISFDGMKNVYSAVPLQGGTYRVNLSSEEDGKGNTYNLSVKTPIDLELRILQDYLDGTETLLQREVLQALDVVMREYPRRNMISFGKSFHQVDTENPHQVKTVEQSLRDGVLDASEGFQHSLKPTSQGLALCLDYSVLAVCDSVGVDQYLMGFLSPDQPDKIIPKLFHDNREKIKKALVGLKVRVTHRTSKSIYVVSGLTDKNACGISFPVENHDSQQPPTSEISLVAYYWSKYKKRIEHENIFCLALGKSNRKNYVPIEFCQLVKGQRISKDFLDKKSDQKLKEMSVLNPQNRRNKILVQKGGLCRGEISKSFGINVERDMTKVKGGVMELPILKIRSEAGEVQALDLDRSQWSFLDTLVVEGTSLKHWAVVVFPPPDPTKTNEGIVNGFVSKLTKRCNKLGLHMENHLFIKWAPKETLKNVGKLTDFLKTVQDLANNNLQLLLCVMPDNKSSGYKYIKWISETNIGVLTQCCHYGAATNIKRQDQYLANLGMKINAKLGGSTTELYKQPSFFDKDAGHVMLIGADVNHPRTSDSWIPSIAAVVASMNWPAATKYIPRISYQANRTEEIQDFGSVCLELIRCYEEINGVKPKKIVIFRDGVSEGQFNMVLNTELQGLKECLKSTGYQPTITVIVAQKRHLTRLFPESNIAKYNISPGTVVDTIIVHPTEFDFYLCSHYGSMGTSKPTHYHVLWDEHNFPSDQLQKFIYDLCFTFAKCCKPVSLVPPIYYADLLAYRGRMYHDAESAANRSSSSNASSSPNAPPPHNAPSPSSASSPSTSAKEFGPYQVHSNIKNFMYFI